MLTVSKWFLVAAGLLLCFDAVLGVAHLPNPIPGWPLPCPLTLTALGVGILLFVFSSKSFKT